MFRKIIESFPFVHHQPPFNMPLRKAVILSLQRPVDLRQIEENILKHLQKNEIFTIGELKKSIAYLRKKRFFKKDSSNLFVAGVRATCKHNPDLGIEFGKSMVAEIPDMRAIRTLVTYFNRTKRFEEIPAIPQHSNDKTFNRTQRNQVFRNTSEIHSPLEKAFPWTFELEKPLKLSK